MGGHSLSCPRPLCVHEPLSREKWCSPAGRAYRDKLQVLRCRLLLLWLCDVLLDIFCVNLILMGRPTTSTALAPEERGCSLSLPWLLQGSSCLPVFVLYICFTTATSSYYIFLLLVQMSDLCKYVKTWERKSVI